MEKPNQKGDNSHEILESRGKKSKVKQLSRPRAATPEAAAEWQCHYAQGLEACGWSSVFFWISNKGEV